MTAAVQPTAAETKELHVMRPTLILALALILAGPWAAGASAQQLTPEYPKCLPTGWSGLVTATGPTGDWQSVRVYFREAGGGDWYYVEMEEGAGGYWSVLPWPEAGAEGVEMYLQTIDAEGNPTSGAPVTVPVVDGCNLSLTGEQAQRAENLVIGETTAEQRGETVAGFECQGIISRIWSDGTVHQDTACRETLMTASAPTGSNRVLGAMVLGAVVGGGVVLASDECPPCSCVCPPCDCKTCQ